MTEQDKSFKLAHTNVRTFYDMARESFELMNSLTESNRRPKPNGEPGWIITHDPAQMSFKAALITIIFCGVYLDALLHLLYVDKQGVENYKKYDRKIYEEKLELLGCDSPSIIDECKHYRTVRNGIVHEKAHLDKGKIRWAQDEAKKAFRLIELVNAHFGVNVG